MTNTDNRTIDVSGTGYVVSLSDGSRREIDLIPAGDPAIATGLLAADFQEVASLSVAPDGNFRRGPTDTAGLKIAVPVAPGEASVLLLEDENGVLSWRFPETAQAPTGRRSEGSVDRYVISDTPNVQEPGRRNFLTDWAIETVTKPIRIRVVRFLARPAVSIAVAHIEGARIPGPVLIEKGLDLSSWLAGDISRIAAKVAQLRKFGAPRVLLLVHGTFSSTAGSYGALVGDPILDQYNLVLGFDHRTLGDDPLSNAEAILATLHALDLPKNTVIDAIAYSRGGLVYRALVEQLVPQSPLNVQFSKVIFVGCTNAGTLLAEPDNWKTLLDIYTNALVAAARIGLGLAGAAPVTPLVVAAIRTMGSFAQMLSQVAISERRVPGLAAMEPSSALIAQLNRQALPNEFATRYFTIGTDFNSAGDDATPRARAALAVLNRVTDRLYGQVPNDMVVPTQSMSDFGLARKAEQQAFIPEEEGIYHTTYFTSALTKQTIMEWLAGAQEVAEPGNTDPSTAQRSGQDDFAPPNPTPLPSESWKDMVDREYFEQRRKNDGRRRRWSEIAKDYIPHTEQGGSHVRRGNAGIDFDDIGFRCCANR